MNDVIVKRVCELTSKEYADCYRLNLRQRGMMQSKLSSCRTGNYGWVFMLYDNDRLLAWALVFGYSQYNAYFYTRVCERGKGYGSQLIKAIQSFTDKITVYPWNNSNDRFFSKFTFHKSYVYWKTGEKRYAAC